MGGCWLGGAAGAHRLSEFGEQSSGSSQADAGVGDALAVNQLAARDKLLRSGDEVASSITPTMRRSPPAI